MDARQESQFNMMRTTKNYLTANATITATVPIIATLEGDLDDTNNEILQVIILQGVPIGGVAVDKNDAKTLMCRLTSQAAGAGKAYAKSVGNDTLLEALNFSFSDLMRERDDEAGPRCAGILVALNGVAAAILPYGVTAAKLTAISEAIEAYITIVPSVRTAEVSREIETDKLETLLKKNMDLLNDQLDGIIQLMDDEHHDFVTGYFLSRTLIDPKHFSTALRVAVVDNATDLEIANPTMNVTDVSVVVNGDLSGIILWKPAVQGDHTFTIEADTYAPYDGSVHLPLGGQVNLTVKLNRMP